MNSALLNIKDLEVIYQTDLETVYAVNRISLTLNKGETLGIVGETGAGKTTTALSILRLLPDRTAKITSGSIHFQGKDLLSISENEMRRIRGKKISMVFQDPMTALNPVLTIGEQIAEALLLHNEEENHQAIEKRVEENLEMVGISAARKTDYPHQFSGGMKQRVIIAIALACNPELLIADEPTTALDVTIQAQVLAMMNDLKDKLDTAVIMITHDLGIVAETCDRVAVMYAGELIELGTIEDIFSETNNHHPYTNGLFGSIPDLEGDEDRLSPIDGLMPDPTNLPSGCKFSPRCPKCMDICKTTPPPIISSGSHQISCHLFNEDQSKDIS